MSTTTSDRIEQREHVVQFYQHDDELVATVTRYVMDAMQADEAVVVVTTADHAVAFDAALSMGGVDPIAARADGTLVSFDAGEALSRFMVDDWPDADAFANEVGNVIRGLVGAGRSVSVFGEMVSLLWDAGHVGAAIELESIWNDLGRSVPFSLLCAYPASSVTGTDDWAAFQRVCHCHSAVIGDVDAIARECPPPAVATSEAERTFCGEATVLSATRQFVASTLRSWGLQQYMEDASIVVSELATNAVIHAHSAFTVGLSSDGTVLRVSVHDASPVLPVVRQPEPTTVSGRGLVLVASIASRWGIELVDDGKLIWAELRG
ncbi:MAG: MEDS domain-containing protein [Ilumatobacteraceae bacterium]